MLTTIIILAVAAALCVLLRKTGAGLIACGIVTAIALALTGIITVPASHVAVVTTFGKVSPETLTEGLHVIAPWSKTHNVYLGQQTVSTNKSEAGSRDLQSVHASLVVNFTVDPARARDLYMTNPSLSYAGLLLTPATHETFKAVVARYTAEELVTKRQEVSAAIQSSLRERMNTYFLRVENINLVDFGFSKAFNAAIEEKVTANQKAATAENNLKRVRFEAEQRIAQAEGEAKAIAIQAAAVEKAGGTGYVHLQAIAKWDGKLPQYVTSGSAMPFVNVK